MNTKILAGGIALAAVFTLGTQYAQADQIPGQGRGQGNGMYEMRQKGNMMQVKERFENRPELSEEQRDELQEIRKDGDVTELREKMEEFGITPRGPQGLFLGKLTDDQRDEIKILQATGDREAIHEQLDEWGIELPQDQKVEDLKDILDADEIKDLEEAHETIRTIIDNNKDKLENAGIKGFFGRVGGFFKGLFK